MQYLLAYINDDYKKQQNRILVTTKVLFKSSRYIEAYRLGVDFKWVIRQEPTISNESNSSFKTGISKKLVRNFLSILYGLSSQPYHTMY